MALSRQIWCQPVVLDLVVVPLWKEQQVAWERGVGCAENRARYVGHSDSPAASVCPPSPSHRGDTKRWWTTDDVRGEIGKLE
jgi:hypothetical protein